VVVELACQAVAFVQFRGLDRYKADPLNFVQASSVPGLTYELKPGFDQVIDGRRTRINHLGFREDTDDKFADKRRVAVFGDSVAMGTGATQDATIAALLQKKIDPEIARAKVLNCGMLGLGLAEFPALLDHVFGVYKPDAVVFILNPNDFVLRDTLYEGADGGMYRMFERPFFKTPLVARKAVYRMKKGGISPSQAWYRWTFEGTKAAIFPRFDELKKICDDHGAGFHVVLMPVRASYDKDDRTIPDIYREIAAYLTAHNIAWSDPSPAFAAAGATGAPAGDSLIDFTDHYTPAGSQVMADALAPVVAKFTQ
jgi:lysophospholipase L1-like esterase